MSSDGRLNSTTAPTPLRFSSRAPAATPFAAALPTARAVPVGTPSKIRLLAPNQRLATGFAPSRPADSVLKFSICPSRLTTGGDGNGPFANPPTAAPP